MLRHLFTLVLTFTLFSVGCETPTDPDEGVPPSTDKNRVHHIGQTHQSLYGGVINYSHGHHLDHDASVRVVVDTSAVKHDLSVSDDLTIAVGTVGFFTFSLGKKPKEDVSVTLAWSSPDVQISPSTPLEFTRDDWGPRVLTVTHTGDQPTTSEFTFTAFGGIDGTYRRRVTVTDSPVGLRPSVSGDVAILPGGAGEVTISLDQPPHVETISVEVAGGSDAFNVSPSTIAPFTHSDTTPRVVRVEHVGKDKSAATNLKVTLRGQIRTPVIVSLDQKNRRATVKGTEQISTTEFAFTFTGHVQSVGRFLPTSEVVFPLAESYGVVHVNESRIRFLDERMTITQTITTERYPLLRVTANLIEIQ